MEITIREYRETDRDDCIKVFKSNVPIFFSHQEVLDFTNFLGRIEKGIDQIPYYVINNDQKLIGCGGYVRDEKNEVFTLAWGLIHKDFHKNGFGEKLLTYRLEKIKKLYKNSSVIIDTTQHSAPFFERYGFIRKKRNG